MRDVFGFHEEIITRGICIFTCIYRQTLTFKMSIYILKLFSRCLIHNWTINTIKKNKNKIKSRIGRLHKTSSNPPTFIFQIESYLNSLTVGLIFFDVIRERRCLSLLDITYLLNPGDGAPVIILWADLQWVSI